MGIRSRLADAQTLYEAGRLEGALLLLLVAVAASARKRYPHPKHGDKESFTRFLGEELKTMTGTVCNVGFENINLSFRQETMTMPELLYKYLRNSLVHEGVIPEDIQFVRHHKLLFASGDIIVFNVLMLQGLVNVVLLSPENASAPPEAPAPSLITASTPSVVLACLSSKSINLQEPMLYDPTQVQTEPDGATASPI